jgi:ketosteroid isomerase-like protein
LTAIFIRCEEFMQHADATEEVLHAFQRYTRAFQALDARAVAQHFHEPAFFITPRDVRALPTTSDVERAYAAVMADMPPDYVRTEFGPLSVHRLGDDLAMVSGVGAWKNAANDDLMPFGVTYTLRRTGRTWRIVVAAIHAPDGGVDR